MKHTRLRKLEGLVRKKAEIVVLERDTDGVYWTFEPGVQGSSVVEPEELERLRSEFIVVVLSESDVTGNPLEMP